MIEILFKIMFNVAEMKFRPSYTQVNVGQWFFSAVMCIRLYTAFPGVLYMYVVCGHAVCTELLTCS